jgi:hypothetical protein
MQTQHKQSQVLLKGDSLARVAVHLQRHLISTLCIVQTSGESLRRSIVPIREQRQQPHRFRWCIAASFPDRGKRRVCNKCLYLVYKSVRNLGFEITCLRKVNKGVVTTLLRLHPFLAHSFLVPYKNLIYVYTVYCFVTPHIIVVLPLIF